MMQKHNRFFAVRLRGTSMLPLLQDGDMLIVKRIEPNEIKIGGIAVFLDKSTNKYIAHRIIGKYLNQAVTKPDTSLLKADNYIIPLEDIAGVVTSLYRKGTPIIVSGASFFHRPYYRLVMKVARDRLMRRIYELLKNTRFSRLIYAILLKLRYKYGNINNNSSV